MRKRHFIKKYLVFIIGFLPFVLFPQQKVQSPAIPNIEVPVRVFSGSQFVTELSLQDFELYENGIPQKIEAMYLVKKTGIERKEEIRAMIPMVSRHFYLLFQLSDYDPQLEPTIDYIFQSLLEPGDTLTVITPLKPYSLNQLALSSRPKEDISKEMQHLLRKDTLTGSAEYRNLAKDLKRVTKAITGSSTSDDSDLESDETYSDFTLELVLDKYKTTLQKLESLRLVDEKKFLNFAQNTKKRVGQKFVFFFYQREYRPEISTNILTSMMSIYQAQQNILSDLTDLFQLYNREMTIPVDKIEQAFADSSLSLHFIFMNKKPDHVFGVTMREQSEDVFSAFSEIAKATGGIVDNSFTNPLSAFKKAVEVSENYYILYYFPENYIKDGTFKTITVKVKDKNYSVSNRLGYFAN